MRIKIHPRVIADNCVVDDNFYDGSLTDASYMIQKLKVAIHSKEYSVGISINSHDQVFIKEFDIWLDKDEYEIMELREVNK